MERGDFMKMKEFLDTLKKEEVLGQIKEAGIYEAGTLNEKLSDKLEKFCAAYRPEGEQILVAGALNNNDFSYMFLDILKNDTEKVLTGLGVIAWLADADETLFYLPEEEDELSQTIREMAGKLDMEIRIERGIVDTRLMRNGVVNHFQTLAAVADILNNQYEAKTMVSVVRYMTSKTVETVVAPCYVSLGTKVSEVTGKLDEVKAVQVGNVLYRLEEIADMVLTEETALGDGVIKLYTEQCCMVDAAFRGLLASRVKSCGKCTFCREGLIQLYTRMKEITDGKGDPSSIGIMKEIGETMAFSCSCTIGNMGSTFLIETMEKFGNEYYDHVKRKTCPAGSCTAFVNIYIDPCKCTGCGKCVKACEGNYIEGLPGYIHMIEDIDCIKCGKCEKVCPEGAIISGAVRMPRLPDRLTKAGRFKRY